MMILVHGLGAHHGSWDGIADELARDFRVVAPDFPGHGYSPAAAEYSVEYFSDLLIELIEHVGGPVVLVGNSMGGLIAEITTSRRPELVSALILLSPATRPDLSVRPPDNAVAAQLLLQSLPGIGNLVSTIHRRRSTPEQQAIDFLKIVMADFKALPPRAIDNAIEMTRLRRTMPWSIPAVVDSAASIRRLFVAPRRFEEMINAIPIPALVLHGELDRIVPSAAIRTLEQLRPDWTVIERPGVGHVLQWEDPDWTIDQVRRWTSPAATWASPARKEARAT